MDFELTIGKKSGKIRLQQDLQGYVAVSSSPNRGVRIVIHKREPDRILLSINDKMYSVVQLRRSPTAVEFVANGESVLAQIKGTARPTDVQSSVASVNELVSANFPAKVVKVQAAPGAKLKEGETLIVVEAMKMEAQIRTPRDCSVLEVYVKEGDMVERGKKLARLKFY